MCFYAFISGAGCKPFGSRQQKRLWRLSADLFWLWLATACCLPASAGSQDTARALRMQNVVKRLVQETGLQVIGLGSWISGKGYVPGVSDHDLRLLMPPGTGPETANRMWGVAQQRLRELIRQEFGSRAPEVLSHTNLYPPTQLMRGVTNPQDALERFIQYKRVPNLGYTGAVTERTPARFTEGMYGVGAGTYVQAYERQAGKLFYSHQGKVHTGMTDLVHLQEGLARYSLHGAANTAGQWAAHLADAIQAGNPKTVLKYLERLELDLTKARDLAQLNTNTALRQELRQLIGKLRANPRALSSLRSAVAQAASRATMEAALLSRYDRAGTLQRGFIRLALDGIEAKNSLGKALNSLFAKLPRVPADKIAQSVVTYFSVVSSSRQLGEGNVVTAASEAGLSLAGLGPGLLMQLTTAMLEGTKEAGYEFVAGRQEAFDLLEGIFTAFGREGVSDRRYTLDQLVQNIHTEERLAAFVRARAAEAATRESNEGRAHDAGVAEAIFNRCFPVILRAWLARREMLAAEFFDLMEALAENPLVLVCQPSPVVELDTSHKAHVTVSPLVLDQSSAEKLERLRQILEILLGRSAKPYVNIYDSWTAGGKAGPTRDSVVYTFTQPGFYPIRLDREISLGAADVPKDCPFVRHLKRFAIVEVQVKSKTPKPPPQPSAEGDFIFVGVKKNDFMSPRECKTFCRDIVFGDTSVSGIQDFGGAPQKISVSWEAPAAAYKAGAVARINVTLSEGAAARVALYYGGSMWLNTLLFPKDGKQRVVELKIPGAGVTAFTIMISGGAATNFFNAAREYLYERRKTQ